MPMMQKEKDILGLYLTGHPLDDYVAEIYKLSGNKISALKASRSKQWLGGLVIGIRTIKTKRGDTMAIVTLDDRSGRIDVTLFSKLFEEARAHLTKDAIIMIEGQIEHDDYSGSLRVRGERVTPLLEMRKKRIQNMSLALDQQNQTSELTQKIKDLIQPYSGGECPLHVRYQLNGYVGEIVLGENWKVEPNDDLIHGLKSLLGAQSVSLNF